MHNILLLTKRFYTNKDVILDRYGRISEFAGYLSNKGHSVTAVCLNLKNRDSGVYYERGVRWESYSLRKPDGFVKFVETSVRYARNADALWAVSEAFFGIWSYFLSRMNSIPVLFDMYDNYEFFFSGRIPLVNSLYRYTTRNTDVVTVVSENLKNLVHSYGRKNGIFIVENAADKNLFFPMDKMQCRRRLQLPLDAKVIGTAGSIYKNRGAEDLIAAFEILSKKYQDLHLVLAGPRDITLPKKQNVHDLGVVHQGKVTEIINALDVAVICNLENDFGKYCFPVKAAETMSCNVPLVSSSVGSMKDLFSNHPEWLFKPSDPRDTAETIERRLGDRRTDYLAKSWEELCEVFEGTIDGMVKARQ